MTIISTVYNGFFRRTSTFALGVIAAAFFFERGLDSASDYIFERHNNGVRTQSGMHTRGVEVIVL